MRTETNLLLRISIQSKANYELELKTLQMKLDQELTAHKETVAKFNADKKHILMSTEEANLEAMKGNLVARVHSEREKRRRLGYKEEHEYLLLSCIAFKINFFLVQNCRGAVQIGSGETGEAGGRRTTIDS